MVCFSFFRPHSLLQKSTARLPKRIEMYKNRKKDILALHKEGNTPSQIADALGITVGTVRKHLRRDI